MSSTRDRLERLLGTPRPRERRPAARPGERSPRLAGHGTALARLESELLGERAGDAESTSLSLKERLERLVAATQARPGLTRPAPAARERREPVAIEAVVDGEEVINDLGRCFQRVRTYPLSHRHGRMTLGRLLGVPREAFSLLSRGDDDLGVDPSVDLNRALFLDTETTGLAGGSGTCAFLVGLGSVEDDAFVVRQLFMREYREEPAMLAEVAERIDSADVLVSFNGKSYDVPLLESRFILSRQRFSFEDRLHFDLLHPARSLWKARLESCRLAELEGWLLGLERGEDIPGHLIPESYFRYLRLGDASRLRYVFEHNCDDILSLAALTVVASDMLDEEMEPDDPRDDYSLGRLFERSARPDRSMRHYRRALDGGLGGAARRRSLVSLASQLKRLGDDEGARALWEELAPDSSLEGVRALHELAMLEEHRDERFDAALARCQRALDELDEHLEWPLRAREQWRAAFEHRKRRLLRRQQ